MLKKISIGLFFMGLALNIQAQLVLQFENVSIIEFIRTVSQYTDKNFIYNEADMKGSVTVNSHNVISEKELMDIFYATLKVNKLYPIQKGSYTQIIKYTDVADYPDTVQGHINGDIGIVTLIRKVEGVDVKVIAPVLTRLKSSAGLVSYVTGANVLVLRDNESKLHKMEDVVSALEKAAKDKSIYVFDIKNTTASKVGAKLQLYFKGLKRTSAIGADPVILFDDSSNIVIVSAEKNFYQAAKKIISSLDNLKAKERNVPKTYYLKNAKSLDVEKILNRLLEGELRGDQKRERFEVVASEATNSITAMGDVDLYTRVESLIEQLDIPRRQVFVEALIIETSLAKNEEFGVEWMGNIVSGNSFQSTLGFQDSGTVANYSSTGNISAGGFNLGILGDIVTYQGNPYRSLSALVNVIQSDSTVNILSNPQILTLDNEKAKIFVGESRPFQTKVSFDSNNNPIQEFDYNDIGVELRITPLISSSDEITLDIAQEIKQVIEVAGLSATTPATLTRHTETRVKMNDGATMVISGLIKDNSNMVETGIPGLSKLPLLGWLFKNTKETGDKTNMMVFISTHIIHSQEDADELTYQKRYDLPSNSNFGFKDAIDLRDKGPSDEGKNPGEKEISSVEDKAIKPQQVADLGLKDQVNSSEGPDPDSEKEAENMNVEMEAVKTDQVYLTQLKPVTTASGPDPDRDEKLLFYYDQIKQDSDYDGLEEKNKWVLAGIMTNQNEKYPNIIEEPLIVIAPRNVNYRSIFVKSKKFLREGARADFVSYINDNKRSILDPDIDQYEEKDILFVKSVRFRYAMVSLYNMDENFLEEPKLNNYEDIYKMLNESTYENFPETSFFAAFVRENHLGINDEVARELYSNAWKVFTRKDANVKRYAQYVTYLGNKYGSIEDTETLNVAKASLSNASYKLGFMKDILESNKTTQDNSAIKVANLTSDKNTGSEVENNTSEVVMAPKKVDYRSVFIKTKSLFKNATSSDVVRYIDDIKASVLEPDIKGYQGKDLLFVKSIRFRYAMVSLYNMSKNFLEESLLDNYEDIYTMLKESTYENFPETSFFAAFVRENHLGINDEVTRELYSNAWKVFTRKDANIKHYAQYITYIGNKYGGVEDTEILKIAKVSLPDANYKLKFMRDILESNNVAKNSTNKDVDIAVDKKASSQKSVIAGKDTISEEAGLQANVEQVEDNILETVDVVADKKTENKELTKKASVKLKRINPMLRHKFAGPKTAKQTQEQVKGIGLKEKQGLNSIFGNKPQTFKKGTETVEDLKQKIEKMKKQIALLEKNQINGKSEVKITDEKDYKLPSIFGN